MEGINVVENGKMQKKVKVLDVRKLEEMLEEKIKKREDVVEEKEMGIGKLKKEYDEKGKEYKKILIERKI